MHVTKDRLVYVIKIIKTTEQRCKIKIGFFILFACVRDNIILWAIVFNFGSVEICYFYHSLMMTVTLQAC